MRVREKSSIEKTCWEIHQLLNNMESMEVENFCALLSRLITRIKIAHLYTGHIFNVIHSNVTYIRRIFLYTSSKRRVQQEF